MALFMLNHHVLAEVAYDSGARTYAVDFPDRQPWLPSGFSFQVCTAYTQVVSCEDSADTTIPADEKIRQIGIGSARERLGNSSVSMQSGDDRSMYCFPCVNRVGIVS